MPHGDRDRPGQTEPSLRIAEELGDTFCLGLFRKFGAGIADDNDLVPRIELESRIHRMASQAL